MTHEFDSVLAQIDAALARIEGVIAQSLTAAPANFEEDPTAHARLRAAATRAVEALDLLIQAHST